MEVSLEVIPSIWNARKPSRPLPTPPSSYFLQPRYSTFGPSITYTVDHIHMRTRELHDNWRPCAKLIIYDGFSCSLASAQYIPQYCTFLSMYRENCEMFIMFEDYVGSHTVAALWLYFSLFSLTKLN